MAVKWECCKEELESNFCPNCGKKSDNPLVELLRHCESRVEALQKKTDSGKATKRTPEDLAKWGRWREALNRVIDQAEAKGES